MEKNILDILKEKGTGFVTPKGYFNTVEDTVESKLISEKLSVKDGFNVPENYFETIEASVFSKVKNERVPQGYFNTVEDSVFEKIKAEESTNVIDFNARLKKVLIPLAVAASLLIVFTTQYNTSAEPATIELAGAEIDALIEDDYIHLNSYEIAEVFNDVSLTENETDDELEALDYINGTEIESLILEN